MSEGEATEDRGAERATRGEQNFTPAALAELSGAYFAFCAFPWLLALQMPSLRVAW